MAVESLRRGRGFHKRRHRLNAARAELAEAAKAVVTETVEPPLVRRQGKGKGGDGKGGKGKGKDGKGKGAEPSAAPAASAPPLVAAPLPTATPPSNSVVLNPGVPAQETVVPPAVVEQCHDFDGGDLGADNADQHTDPDNLTTIVSTQIDTSTSLVGSLQTSLTSFTIASPLPTLQTSLASDASSTSTPFVASTPYQAAPSSTTTAPASSRAPAIAPGTIAGIVVGVLSLFFLVLGAICLFSRRTRRRLLAPVTRRFTNNTLVNSDSRGMGSTGRQSGRGGDMHKSLVSEAESMAYTTIDQRDVKPPPMAMVGPPMGLSQHPVFMPPHNDPSRPNSWRTWRPSATFAQGLDPLPDDLQLPPPPPPHALTARYSGLPRGSGVSTGGDSSTPEYGAWPPTPSNANLTALAPGPGYRQQQQNTNLPPGYVVTASPGRVQDRDYERGQQIGEGHGSYLSYSETPLATPRTPKVVEEVSPVDNCDNDSGEAGDAGRSRDRNDDVQASEHRGSDNDYRRGGGGVSGLGEHDESGGIQEARLGREAGAGGGHGGGPQGVEEEPPREQGQQAEQDQQDERPSERGEQAFEEVEAVAAVQGQPGRRSSSTGGWSQWWSFRLAPPSRGDREASRSSSSSAGFSWSEAASEPYTAPPRDGFGLSIIGARHGSSRSRAAEEGAQGPCTAPF
ncbi:hypothetical protein KVR01_008212 [Diaporthe batatas]|uniref:uncharacterized protein n=1 Tax=Diaporthe batatas TaxID=748121 RepID=UPI001D03987B|nr:uncharacterized protein KVR01_008212 [Diaporthe batatas]KAG8162447.1 hypothetical protein KVR01_008212 [Diaporthe batatas]